MKPIIGVSTRAKLKLMNMLRENKCSPMQFGLRIDWTGVAYTCTLSTPGAKDTKIELDVEGATLRFFLDYKLVAFMSGKGSIDFDPVTKSWLIETPGYTTEYISPESSFLWEIGPEPALAPQTQRRARLRADRKKQKTAELSVMRSF